MRVVRLFNQLQLMVYLPLIEYPMTRKSKGTKNWVPKNPHPLLL